MINQLDEMIQTLLDTELNDPSLPWTIDVAVRPPDSAWRATVSANGRPAVSIFMVDVNEARNQRTTAASRAMDAEPFRVDCHYLISVWIPTSDPGFGTPTVVEDWLLSQVLAILANNAPLDANQIYGDTPPPGLEPILAANPLPTSIVPPEGFKAIADFWTGMGQGNTWRPSAHLVITLPLIRTQRPTGPPVRILSLTTNPTLDQPETLDGGHLDRATDIGGVITDGTGPVRAAWVRLSDHAGTRTVQSAATDEDGRYAMFGLPPGDYRLTAGSTDHSPQHKTIEIPASVGTYDLVLT